VRPAAALLVVSAAVLTACGGGPAPLAPELVVGAAPTGRPPLALPAYEPGSLAPAAEWPRACDLLADDEVRAVLPQATAIVRTGAADTIDADLLATLGTGPGPSGGAPADAGGIAVPERTCSITIGLPAVADDGGPAEATGSVEVRVTMVGGADTVGYFWSPFHPQPQPLPDPPGAAAECVQEFPDHRPDASIGTFDCRTDRMSISLTTGFTVLDGWHVRVAGDRANTDPGAAGQWFRERVGPALLGVVARRLPLRGRA
jgi:hypothetical protein